MKVQSGKYYFKGEFASIYKGFKCKIFFNPAILPGNYLQIFSQKKNYMQKDIKHNTVVIVKKKNT